MPGIGGSGMRPASGGCQMGIRCRRVTAGPSSDGERAAGNRQRSGRGRQLPARPKPAADGLSLHSTVDSWGEFRHLPAVAMQTAPVGFSEVWQVPAAMPHRQVTARAAECPCS